MKFGEYIHTRLRAILLILMNMEINVCSVRYNEPYQDDQYGAIGSVKYEVPYRNAHAVPAFN